MLRNLILSAVLTLCAVQFAGAQEWANKMFKVQSHNFGSVARGSKTEFKFELTNIYVEDVHVLSVRASCGCTTPIILKDTIKTHETGAILARFNTGTFTGQKSATVTVTFDKPFPAEVQLRVQGNIRDDVVIEPGSVDFGSYDQGEDLTRSISIHHHNNSNWKITDVRSAHKHVRVKLQKLPGVAGSKFNMQVTLAGSTPPGYIQDQLTLVTNDPVNPTLTIPMEGRVVSALTVSPSLLSLGVLKPEETVKGRLVVRAKKPFRINGIQCQDDCFQFEKAPSEAKKIHLIPVVFTATKEPGKISQRIEISTDLGAAFCNATATVVAEQTGE